MKRKRALLLMVAALPALLTVRGQDMMLDRFNVACLDLNAGLPHNNVNDIFVDSKGFVWISSYGGGAVRYDGYTFLSPSLIADQGFLSKACKGFTEDAFHRLWIAYDEGTQVVDMRTMTAVTPTVVGAGELTALRREAVKVYCDTKGGLWHVMRDSVYRYTFDDEGRVKHVSRCRYYGNTPDISICDIEQNGTVWISIENGLYRLSEVGERLERHEIAPVMSQLQGCYVTDMLKRGSVVWVTTNRGLYAYDIYRSTLQAYRHTDDARSLAHDYATALALTPDGRLLVGTLHGLCIFDEESASFDGWHSSSPGMPMPSDFINCMLAKGHQLWIGTETAGVVKLSPKPLIQRNYVHQEGDAGSLSAHPVNAMYVENDGTLWVGTVEGGLNRRDADGRFTHWTTHNSGLSHNSVSMLEPDKQDRLWIGTWGGGLNVTSLKANGPVRQVSMPADMASQTAYIGALAYDAHNQLLWIGSNDGVFAYDPATGKVEDPFLHNREIRGCIGAHIDRSGQLWMGCLSGVCVINLKSGRDREGRFRVRMLRNKLNQPQSAVVDKITCFCETTDGTLWLGSNGYGLYRRVVADDGKERFEVLTTDDGLANNAVKGIVEDGQGRLWITTNNGLSVYDVKAGVFMNYGEREGLLCQHFYWNSVVKGTDGAIYLGSIKGVTEIRGENSDAETPVRLCFTRLTVDNQEMTAADHDILDADISQAATIRLHESHKSFTLSFSTLTYSGDVQGHYCYRMKGFENEWTTLRSGQHEVRYTSLKPGFYTFEVMYLAEGHTDGDVISIGVKVAPYFWKSWWFTLLMLLMLAGVSALLYRRRIATLRRQAAERLLTPIRKAMDESDAPEQLQARIQHILDTHQHLKQSYHRSVEADRQQAMRHNRPFMQQATEVMEQHYMQSSFGITEFAEAMGMSRPLLAKRLKSEAGLTAGQFIRNYRLTVAKKLIMENMANRNITEIAYKVGFNDPKYFTRCFTHTYGHSPSTYVGEDKNVAETEDKPV